MAEGKHAPWRLWILIVLWVLQLLLLGYSLIIYIVALVAIAHWDEFDSLSKPSIVFVLPHLVTDRIETNNLPVRSSSTC